MNTKNFAIVALLLVAVSCLENSQSCQDLIAEIVKKAKEKDFSAIPLESIMFSGITSNTLGQRHECEMKKGPSKFSFFLVSWKNTTNGMDLFTGLCVPQQCQKSDVQQLASLMGYQNSVVYDYSTDSGTNGLQICAYIVVGLFVAILVVSSCWQSFREPYDPQLIKKKQDPPAPINSSEVAVNSLSQINPFEVKQQTKLFNFYAGYCDLFKLSNQKNYLAPLLVLSTLSIIISTQFSYKQSIAKNQDGALKWFDSFGGVLFANVQIAFSVIMFVLGAKLAFSLFKLDSFKEILRYFFDQLLVKWGILIFMTLFAYIFLGFIDKPLNQIWLKNYGQDCPSTLYKMWLLFRNLQTNTKASLQWFWILEVDILLSIVAAPFFLILKTKKIIGNILFGLIILISIFTGIAILDSNNVIFEPYKLFNMSKDFTIRYQTHGIVRMTPYFLGLLSGFLISQGLKNIQKDKKNNSRLLSLVRNSHKVQIGLHVVGALLMISMLLIIIPYLSLVQKAEKQSGAYAYLVLTPLVFLIGLFMFILPCFWQGDSKLSVFLSNFLGSKRWRTLEKMSITMVLLGPAVIGFTTYSLQSAVYLDFETILVYFLGDWVITLLLTIIVMSGLNYQLDFLSKYTQSKLFKKTSDYSLLLVDN